MSKKNRLYEFKRLMDLGREKDICQSLMDEFVPRTEPKKPKGKKKNGS